MGSELSEGKRGNMKLERLKDYAHLKEKSKEKGIFGIREEGFITCALLEVRIYITLFKREYVFTLVINPLLFYTYNALFYTFAVPIECAYPYKCACISRRKNI